MKTIGLLVYDCSLVGGAERVAINMAKELSAFYKVHLISLFSEKDKSVYESEKYTSAVISSTSLSITKHFFKLSGKIKKYIKENNIEVLFAITAGVVTLAVNAASGIKTKVVYCEHSTLVNKTYGKKHELRQLIGAKLSDVSVALTKEDMGYFKKMYKLPDRKLRYIYNWSEFEPVLAPYDEESRKIISVGRLEYVKGYDLLLEAAEKVYEKHPQWHWDIYGGGSYKEKIESGIKEKKLENFITLKGSVNDLNKRYSEYSFFVQTSYYEGFSLTLLEARLSGLPTVSFNCPTGPMEIVADGVNGILVPCYDTEKLADAVNKLIENSELRVSMALHSGDNIEKFSKEKIIEEWKALIKELTEG